MKTLTLFISILFSIVCLANDKSTKDSIWDGLDAITPEEHERRQLANKKNGFDDLLTPRQKCLYIIKDQQSLIYFHDMLYKIICKNIYPCIKEPDYYIKCINLTKSPLKNFYNSFEKNYIKKSNFKKCLQLTPFLNKNEEDFIKSDKIEILSAYILNRVPDFCISKNTCIKIYTSLVNEYEKIKCNESAHCSEILKIIKEVIITMKHSDDQDFKILLKQLIRNKVDLEDIPYLNLNNYFNS